MSTVIGVFSDKDSAEHAINALKDSGFNDQDISLVAKNDQGDDNGGGYANQNLTNGTATGGTLGGIAGIAAGLGALAIPGVGPIIAAGPIAAGLTGAAAGGITGGLVDLGIPKSRGDFYQNEVKSGKILTAVEADHSNIDDVASILRDNGAQDVETH